MGERLRVDAEQCLRPQFLKAEQAEIEDCPVEDPRGDEARQQQRIGPDSDADGEPGDRAARGRALPEQPTEEGRRELRDGRERQQPDLHELCLAGRVIVEIGEQQHAEDRESAGAQQKLAHVLAVGALAEHRADAAAAQNQRHHDVVRHHDGERDALHDDHGGRGGEAADEGEQRHGVGAGGERQRQHEHIAVDATLGEQHQAGDGDRHHEQIDQHEIDREQPRRAPHVGLVVVLDHGDVELARQQHDGEEGQQGHRDPGRRIDAVEEHRKDVALGGGLGE